MIKNLVAASVLIGGLVTGVQASPLNGNFDIDGSVTVTQDAITWKSNGGVNNQATITQNSDLSGDFAGLGNSTVNIQNLVRASEPVNSFFPPMLFLDFVGHPALSALDVDFIPMGVGGTANCPPTPPAAGQTCTPAVPGGSPFTFLNTTTGSSATWDVKGVTADGLSSWVGIFTAQFTSDFQTVLNTFNTQGMITNSFSATFTVTPVPEPQPMLLLGAGLMVLSMVIRRKNRA